MRAGCEDGGRGCARASADPLLEAVLAHRQPLHLFLRDDDAGWGDEALRALLDTVLGCGAAIDLAVIPEALSAPQAAWLRRLPASVGLHQHGHRHANHEPEGTRRSEFGPHRALAAQRADLIDGRARLADSLGERLDPWFTPPWNRCRPETPALLAELGFAGLSRDAGAPPQQALPELPVHTDWTRHWREGGEAAVLAHLARCYRQALAGQSDDAPQPVTLGLMLHHAVMDEAERRALAAGLRRWLADGPVTSLPMRQAWPAVAGRAAGPQAMASTGAAA